MDYRSPLFWERMAFSGAGVTTGMAFGRFNPDMADNLGLGIGAFLTLGCIIYGAWLEVTQNE